MKKIIFTMLMSFCMVGAYAQLKVASNGFTKIGNIAVNPTTQLDVQRALTVNSQQVSIFSNTGTANGFGIATNAASTGNANIGLLVAGVPRGNIGYDVSRNFLGFLNQAYTSADFQLRFVNDGSLRFHDPLGGAPAVVTILKSGNIGVGIAVPTAKIHLSTDSALKPGTGTWQVSSDQNLKKDIQDFKDGLVEIMKIRPVNFKYNGKGGVEDTNESYVGVIAQEVQEIAPYMVGSYSHVPVTYSEVSGNLGDNGEKRFTSVEGQAENYLSVDPNAFTYMLINAVKEQQVQIEEKDERINELEDRLNALADKVNEIVNQYDVTLGGGGLSDAGSVGQNIPNPFSGETQIAYTIPEKASSASMNIFDISGRLLKTIPISHTGKGMVNVNADQLPAGTYSYQLVVDNQILGAKKMIKSH